MMKTIVLAACGLLMASCATGYQEDTFWSDGGVTATRVTDDTYIISSAGNPYTPQAVVLQHSLRKAAEQTLAAGAEWFVLVDERDSSSTSTLVSAQAGFALATPLTRRGLTMTVRTGTGPRPEGAYDARQVLANLER